VVADGLLGACTAAACVAASAGLPTGIAVWMKMESPQMIGVDVPRPGILTFHRTFFPSAQVVGGSAVGATPLASGPRHCAQLASGVSAARAIQPPTNIANVNAGNPTERK
jgi:hypothetical protein